MKNDLEFTNPDSIKKNQDRPDYTIAGSGLNISPEEKEAKIRLVMKKNRLSREAATKEVEDILAKAPGLQRDQEGRWVA